MTLKLPSLNPDAKVFVPTARASSVSSPYSVVSRINRARDDISGREPVVTSPSSSARKFSAAKVVEGESFKAFVPTSPRPAYVAPREFSPPIIYVSLTNDQLVNFLSENELHNLELVANMSDITRGCLASEVEGSLNQLDRAQRFIDMLSEDDLKEVEMDLTSLSSEERRDLKNRIVSELSEDERYILKKRFFTATRS